MLDVILYGYDSRGQLTLHERPFADIRQLAQFFRCPDNSSRWEWAEVEIAAGTDHARVVKYSADALRGMIVSSSRVPSVN